MPKKLAISQNIAKHVTGIACHAQMSSCSHFQPFSSLPLSQLTSPMTVSSQYSCLPCCREVVQVSPCCRAVVLTFQCCWAVVIPYSLLMPDQISLFQGLPNFLLLFHVVFKGHFLFLCLDYGDRIFYFLPRVVPFEMKGKEYLFS